MEDSGANPALAKAEPVARLGPSGFDPGELLALAERCEQATGPDPDLDGEIWLQAGSDEMLGKSWAYTASLDAAMTLVPEGHCGQVQFGKHPGAWVAALAEQHPDDFNMAVTPALGLCAAALKARALAPIETGTAKSRRL